MCRCMHVHGTIAYAHVFYGIALQDGIMIKNCHSVWKHQHAYIQALRACLECSTVLRTGRLVSLIHVYMLSVGDVQLCVHLAHDTIALYSSYSSPLQEIRLHIHAARGHIFLLSSASCSCLCTIYFSYPDDFFSAVFCEPNFRLPFFLGLNP
jgi:hypothetical protein